MFDFSRRVARYNIGYGMRPAFITYQQQITLGKITRLLPAYAPLPARDRCFVTYPPKSPWK